MSNKPSRRNPKQNEVIVEAQQSSWSGPIPSPQILEAFNHVVPGSAEVIINAFHNQTNHRMEIEKMVISSNIKKESRGQLFGLAIAILGLSISGICIYFGHDLAGAALGGTTLVGLVSVFGIGKTIQYKSLQKKNVIKTKKT